MRSSFIIQQQQATPLLRSNRTSRTISKNTGSNLNSYSFQESYYSELSDTPESSLQNLHMSLPGNINYDPSFLPPDMWSRNYIGKIKYY